MSAMSKDQWIAARSDWEGGLSLDKVAKKYGVSVTTVRSHKEKEGWTRMDTAVSEGPEQPVITADALTPLVAESEAIAALEARLAAAQAELAAAEAQNQALKKDIKLTLPRTVEEVIQFFTRKHMEHIALTRHNRERRSQGFNPVELVSGDPTLEAEVQRTAAQFLKRQTSWAGESNLRTLKMARVDPESPTGYRIIGIPLEPQINNMTAAPDEAVARYIRRGWKLITPQLCQRGPCYAQAAYENGKLAFDGYCSVEHRAGDPFLNANVKKGATTTAVAFSSGMPLTAVR